MTVSFSHLGDVTSEVMCTMGVSATITQTEVIVGSPGSFEWQGEAPPTACHRGPRQPLTLRVCVCIGNVHVSWMNPHVLFDTERSSFTNLHHRNIYIGEGS